MEQPESFVIHGQENKVCKLDNSLYGLNKFLRNDMKNWHSNAIK